MPALTLSEMSEIERYWINQGLGTKAAKALAINKIKDEEQLGQIGPNDWRAFYGIGRKAWNEVRYFAGWPDNSGIEVRYAYDKELVKELKLRGWTCVPPGEKA